MKIKPIFFFFLIAGENLVVNQGNLFADMTKVISLNGSAVFLWNELADKDFTLDDAADVLVAQYGIEKNVALNDAERWIEKMRECEIIED